MVRQNYGRHLRLIVFTALAALVSALPVAAQGAPITGTVKDAQGNPVEGAKITLDGVDTGRKYETTTGKDGSYVQIGIVGGQYRITVEKAGIGKVTRTLMLRGGTPNRSNFILAPGAGADGEADSKAAALSKVFEAGTAASRAGNQDEAIARFEEVLASRPACSECYYNIGFAQANKKDYEKAEAAYKKAIELKADYADAYTGLASIYNAQRKFDLAAEASKKAAEVSASNVVAGGAAAGSASPDALFNQGVILWNSGKIAEAKVQFEAAIAAKPDHAEAHYQLAMALVNGGDLKGAATEFNTYLKLAPNGPNAAQAKAIVASLPK